MPRPISPHGYEERGLNAPLGHFTATGRFGRMFGDLLPLTSFQPGVTALGAVDGPMDGGSPGPGDTTQNNPRIAAGYTFLGQFIDHDLTLDVTSILERQIDLNATHNFRTPALELDSLYNLGPSVQPYMYMPGGMKFVLPPGELDLPRHGIGPQFDGDTANGNGRAIIGDPRNDENLIVSQLHLLFLKFHNRVVDHPLVQHADEGTPRFLAAQDLVRRHYQWIVLHEFLPRIVGQARVDATMANRPFVYPDDAFMPVEFSVAAYRFGHSQTRPGYVLNGPPITAGPLFADPPVVGDLRGFRPVAPERAINWNRFFGSGPVVQASKLVDTKLSTAMLRLPVGIVPGTTEQPFFSLASRNLQRGLDARLPSGQRVAEALVPPSERLTDAEIWANVPGGSGEAPLWFYILREAELKAAATVGPAVKAGLRLAGVGAEIVARTFVAILAADPASILNRDPHWTPTLPSAKPGTFTMTDLVNFTEGREGADIVPGEDLATLPGA